MNIKFTITFATMLLVFAKIKHAATFEFQLDRAVKASTDKPGECPAEDQNIKCPVPGDQCKSDCECPKQQKCCYQKGCGFICKDPLEPTKVVPSCDAKIVSEIIKPGDCPKPDPIICKQCDDQCTSDCQCVGKQKCCRQPRCGNRCKDAV